MGRKVSGWKVQEFRNRTKKCSEMKLTLSVVKGGQNRRKYWKKEARLLNDKLDKQVGFAKKG